MIKTSITIFAAFILLSFRDITDIPIQHYTTTVFIVEEKYLLECEKGSKDCKPFTIYRQSISDSIRMIFPVGELSLMLVYMLWIALLQNGHLILQVNQF